LDDKLSKEAGERQFREIPVKKIFTGLALFIVAIIIIAVVSNLSDRGVESDIANTVPNVPADIPATPVESAETSAPKEENVKLGEFVSFGRYDFKATGIESAQEIGHVKTENKYIIVNATVINTSKEPLILGDASVSLLDGEGREFKTDMDSGFALIDEGRELTAFGLNPGLKETGSYAFEVPKDAKDFTLLVNDEIKIELGNPSK
jgi:hypothetical protein